MRETLQEKVTQLGPWFHNLHLPGGIETAPAHFLGDFPLRKWREIEARIPTDLNGWSCLDVGCNAGFYSFELAKRGARVLGIDSDPAYLAQARWVAENFAVANPPVFREMQIHELARMEEHFDLVLFLGVFYHLRYPMLALDTVARLTRRLMLFQTLTSDEAREDLPASELPVFEPEDDYPITDRGIFQEPGWPRLSFVEKKYSQDETNWFVPNHSAVEALLRSTDFASVERIAHEFYLCTAPPGGVEAGREWPPEEWLAATGARPKAPKGGLI